MKCDVKNCVQNESIVTDGHDMNICRLADDNGPVRFTGIFDESKGVNDGCPIFVCVYYSKRMVRK